LSIWAPSQCDCIPKTAHLVDNSFGLYICGKSAYRSIVTFAASFLRQGRGEGLTPEFQNTITGKTCKLSIFDRVESDLFDSSKMTPELGGVFDLRRWINTLINDDRKRRDLESGL
jgi:hypothetical protein